jgi:hypothetical protein
MFFTNDIIKGPRARAIAQNRGYTAYRMSANGVVAFRSAPKENRVPEWKTGGAIFMCGDGEVA